MLSNNHPAYNTLRRNSWDLSEKEVKQCSRFLKELIHKERLHYNNLLKNISSSERKYHYVQTEGLIRKEVHHFEQDIQIALDNYRSEPNKPENAEDLLDALYEGIRTYEKLVDSILNEADDDFFNYLPWVDEVFNLVWVVDEVQKHFIEMKFNHKEAFKIYFLSKEDREKRLKEKEINWFYNLLNIKKLFRPKKWQKVKVYSESPVSTQSKIEHSESMISMVKKMSSNEFIQKVVKTPTTSFELSETIDAWGEWVFFKNYLAYSHLRCRMIIQTFHFLTIEFSQRNLSWKKNLSYDIKSLLELASYIHKLLKVKSIIKDGQINTDLITVIEQTVTQAINESYLLIEIISNSWKHLTWKIPQLEQFQWYSTKRTKTTQPKNKIKTPEEKQPFDTNEYFEDNIITISWLKKLYSEISPHVSDYHELSPILSSFSNLRYHVWKWISEEVEITLPMYYDIKQESILTNCTFSLQSIIQSLIECSSNIFEYFEANKNRFTKIDKSEDQWNTLKPEMLQVLYQALFPLVNGNAKRESLLIPFQHFRLHVNKDLDSIPEIPIRDFIDFKTWTYHTYYSKSFDDWIEYIKEAIKTFWWEIPQVLEWDDYIISMKITKLITKYKEISKPSNKDKILLIKNVIDLTKDAVTVEYETIFRKAKMLYKYYAWVVTLNKWESPVKKDARFFFSNLLQHNNVKFEWLTDFSKTWKIKNGDRRNNLISVFLIPYFNREFNKLINRLQNK